MYYTVATNTGEEVVKHYPHDEQGMLTAYSHAKKFGYEVWESFEDGQPRYLLKHGKNTKVD
jgi:hypothetical protein